jgi:starch phosphorylase
LRLTGSVGNRIEFNQSVTLEVDVTQNGLTTGDIRLECVVSREICSDLTVPVRQFADRAMAEPGLRQVGADHVYVQTFEAVGRADADGVHRYRVELRPPWCGALHYQIRAVPWHPQLSHPYELGLMRWI